MDNINPAKKLYYKTRGKRPLTEYAKDKARKYRKEESTEVNHQEVAQDEEDIPGMSMESEKVC